MPMTPGCQLGAGGEGQHRRLRHRFDRGDRRRQGAGLDLATLAVVVVEALRQFGGERRIVGRQQPRAEIGRTHPPAGIDPRAQHEAQMIRVDRLADAGDCGQGVEAGVAARAAPP